MTNIDNNNPELKFSLCSCMLCNRADLTAVISHQSLMVTSNGMSEFIKRLPINLPILIQQTIIVHRQGNVKQLHAYNNLSREQSKKWNIVHNQLKGLHSIISQNVLVYFLNQEKILNKYQASSLMSQNKVEILYIQPYQVDSSLSILYPFNIKEKLDNVLREHIQSQEGKIMNENYKINEEFLQWIHIQYGQQTFYYYLTEYYARIFKILTKGEIKAGLFFWTSQKINSEFLNLQTIGGERDRYNSMIKIGLPKKLSFKPKLINIKGLQIKEFQKLYSFDEEYQNIIKGKIQNSNKKSISAIKNKGYRSRLSNFQSKLHDFYKKQQKETMDGIEKEKKYEFEVDSQKMAQLLIPNMAPYKNLRQILNNQAAFRQVFMNKKKQRKQRLITENILSGFGIRKTRMINQPQKKESHSLLWQSNTKYNISSSIMTKKYKKLLTTPSTHE